MKTILATFVLISFASVASFAFTIPGTACDDLQLKSSAETKLRSLGMPNVKIRELILPVGADALFVHVFADYRSGRNAGLAIVLFDKQSCEIVDLAGTEK